MPDYADSRKTEKEQITELNEQLLEAQFELRKAGKGPVLLLISGNDFAGKAEIIDTFYAWLDSRFLNTRAYGLPRGVEKKMPRLWRYCRTLPPSGEIGFYLGSWYHQPLMAFSRGKLSEKRLRQKMQDIVRFEQLLVNAGSTILKLWLHLDGKGDDKKTNNSKRQRSETVSMREWGDFSVADYEKVRAGAQLMSDLTTIEGAPWIKVSARDPLQRDMQIGQLLLEAIRARLKDTQAPTLPQSWISSTRAYLDEIDYSQTLSKDDYQSQLERYQNRLRELVRHPRFARHGLLLVFEGTDAAGKGGTIRRITQCLDPRNLRVHGTRAPTEDEQRQPYLMRFWRRIPAPGHIVVFDRSYYGRVLVERVEGFCSTTQWQRAYGEINDFERQLEQAGTIIIKFWLAITPQEQLERFKAREASSLKHYKLTDEDWRNRKQWPAYRDAVHDMLEFTSRPEAPWHLISSEDKRHGRIQALKIVCETLQQALK